MAPCLRRHPTERPSHLEPLAARECLRSSRAQRCCGLSVYALRVPETGVAKEIDELYGLPLDEFTKERDALARRLRSDGRREEAAEVAELRKPVLAAWLVNLLVRERRDDVRELVGAAEAIRKGEAGADDRFRRTADELVRAARELVAGDGRKPTDAVLRDVATTLRAAAAADPKLLTSGRLTQPVEATGFEAMAGAVTRQAPKAREKRDDTRAAKKRVEDARKAVSEARAEARRLGKEADAAEREARRLRTEADRAMQAVADAEERLAAARER